MAGFAYLSFVKVFAHKSVDEHDFFFGHIIGHRELEKRVTLFNSEILGVNVLQSYTESLVRVRRKVQENRPD